MKRCAMCNWPLSGEHIFNVNCATANAEYDQVMAEVEEAVGGPLTEEDKASCARVREMVLDQLAYLRFAQRAVMP